MRLPLDTENLLRKRGKEDVLMLRGICENIRQQGLLFFSDM